MIGFAYAISNNRKAINWRPIFWGIGLQIIFAVLILHLEFGQIFFSGCDRIVNWLLSCADAGTDFVLRSLVTGTVDPSVKNLAFRAIPTIIFFSSFMAILYHLRIMGFIISGSWDLLSQDHGIYYLNDFNAHAENDENLGCRNTFYCR